jgi:hypothetical protein
MSAPASTHRSRRFVGRPHAPLRPARRAFVSGPSVPPFYDTRLANLRSRHVFTVRDLLGDDLLSDGDKARLVFLVGKMVIGTDHAAESLMGFFTKFGDGGADILPLSTLTKRRVRALARSMGADERLVMKMPTADLETLTPQRPDEDSYGISYENIDDFLEGRAVSEEVLTTIHRFHSTTRHKRSLPVAVPRDGRTL